MNIPPPPKSINTTRSRSSALSKSGARMLMRKIDEGKDEKEAKFKSQDVDHISQDGWGIPQSRFTKIAQRSLTGWKENPRPKTMVVPTTNIEDHLDSCVKKISAGGEKTTPESKQVSTASRRSFFQIIPTEPPKEETKTSSKNDDETLLFPDDDLLDDIGACFDTYSPSKPPAKAIKQTPTRVPDTKPLDTCKNVVQIDREAVEREVCIDDIADLDQATGFTPRNIKETYTHAINSLQSNLSDERRRLAAKTEQRKRARANQEDEKRRLEQQKRAEMFEKKQQQEFDKFVDEYHSSMDILQEDLKEKRAHIGKKVAAKRKRNLQVKLQQQDKTTESKIDIQQALEALEDDKDSEPDTSKESSQSDREECELPVEEILEEEQDIGCTDKTYEEPISREHAGDHKNQAQCPFPEETETKHLEDKEEHCMEAISPNPDTPTLTGQRPREEHKENPLEKDEHPTRANSYGESIERQLSPQIITENIEEKLLETVLLETPSIHPEEYKEKDLILEENEHSTLLDSEDSECKIPSTQNVLVETPTIMTETQEQYSYVFTQHNECNDDEGIKQPSACDAVTRCKDEQEALDNSCCVGDEQVPYDQSVDDQVYDKESKEDWVALEETQELSNDLPPVHENVSENAEEHGANESDALKSENPPLDGYSESQIVDIRVEDIISRLSQRIGEYVSAGINWRLLLDTAASMNPARFDVNFEHFCEDLECLELSVFEKCLEEYFQLGHQALLQLSRAFSATYQPGSIRYLYLLYEARTSRFDCWQQVESFRFQLRREAGDWGLGYDLSDLFEDLVGDTVENGSMDAENIKSIASRLGWNTFPSEKTDSVFLAMDPLSRGYIMYHDFVCFVRDPNFHDDVLPRLIHKTQLIAEAKQVASLDEKIRATLIGIKTEQRFVELLVSLGYVDGEYRLSRDEVLRIVARLDLTGQKTRYDIKEFMSWLFADVPIQQSQEVSETLDLDVRDPGQIFQNVDADTVNYEDMIFMEAKKRQAAKALAWDRMREEEDVSSCETGSSEGEEGEEEETEEGREDFIIEEEEDIIEEEDDFIIEEEDGSDDEEEDAWANARVMTKAEKNASVVAVKFDDEDDDEPAHWEAKADRVDPSSGLQNISRRLSPATDDILDFAIYLGMDPEEDREWVWLAEECLYAPLPKGWKQARDVSATGRGDTYYWREDDPDCATQWEHPLDPFFRKLFERLKAEKQQRIDDMKLGGRWSKFERRKRRSARPQSAMPLDRRNSGSRADRTELGVLRTVAKGTSQHLAGRTAVFDFDTTPKKKARPMSALPSRSSAPIVPLNEEDSEEILGGCHDLGESSPSRVKASSRVQPSGSLETYTRESDTVDTPAAEVTEMVLPTHPPFPEDKTRPLWWRKTPETKAVDLSHKVSPEDILELASYFDVELPDEAHLMWVIKLAALAPIPKGWRVCFDEFSTEHFFACEQTFRISRNHPLDPFFALLLEGERDAEAASGSMGAAHTDRVWLAFADDDDDVYYYDFSSNVTCYEQPEAVEKNVPMPLMITQFEAAAGREDFLAYRQALWNSLCGVYEEKSNSIPPIIGLPAAQLLGKEELVRTAMILDWIMQPKNEELQKALEVNNSLKAAVEGRRTTSEQLTRHITLTKK